MGVRRGAVPLPPADQHHGGRDGFPAAAAGAGAAELLQEPAQPPGQRGILLRGGAGQGGRGRGLYRAARPAGGALTYPAGHRPSRRPGHGLCPGRGGRDTAGNGGRIVFSVRAASRCGGVGLRPWRRHRYAGRAKRRSGGFCGRFWGTGRDTPGGGPMLPEIYDDSGGTHTHTWTLRSFRRGWRGRAERLSKTHAIKGGPHPWHIGRRRP